MTWVKLRTGFFLPNGALVGPGVVEVPDDVDLPKGAEKVKGPSEAKSDGGKPKPVALSELASKPNQIAAKLGLK